MPCGICKQSGHNARTCPGIGVSEYLSSPPVPRTYRCGECGEGGHNRQTCPLLKVPRTYRCGECGIEGHNRQTCPLLKISPSPSHHNRDRQNVVATESFLKIRKKENAPKKSDSRSQNEISTINSSGSNRSYSTHTHAVSYDSIQELLSETFAINRGFLKSAQVVREEKDGLKKAITARSQPSTKYVADGTILSSAAASLSRKESGKESRLNKATSDKGQDQSGIVQKSKKKSQPGENWLNSDALERLLEGPTSVDAKGEGGYIYIYKLNNPKNKVDAGCYKIGCSKDLPERRIRAQENKNDEDYTILFSAETPFKFLTDTVIKRQLKDSRSFTRRDEEGFVKDGGTEWYEGDKDYFTNTIKKVIREVKIRYE